MKVIVIGNFAPSNYQTQIDTLARHFETEGIEVIRVSSRTGKVGKGLDVTRTLVLPPGGPRSVDVVVAQLQTDFSFAYGVLSTLAGRLTGVPTVLLYHSSWSRLGSARALLQTIRPLATPMFRAAFDVQVASPYLGGLLEEIGVQASVVPHVLDDRWVPGEARSRVRPRILWPRALHPIYDPFTAIQVFERVRERHPDARMTMVGDGPLAGEVDRHLAQGRFPGVTRLPNQPVEALRDLYRDHDLYLHTNRFDNQPLTLLEAFSQGLVAVTTNVGGMPWVFEPGEGGFQVDPGDPDAAADQVLRLVDDPVLAATTSRRALVVADRHRWSSLRGPWLDVLGRAAASRHR